MIKIYTKKNCPNCEIKKKELQSKGIPFIEISADTDEGMFEAISHNFMSFPGIINE